MNFLKNNKKQIKHNKIKIENKIQACIILDMSCFKSFEG
jgi:hypothetical protein